MNQIKSQYTSSKQPGFTLVELILYVSLTAIVLSVLAYFLSAVFFTSLKNTAMVEVEQQGVAILQRITQTLRNAQAVNYPAPGITNNALSVASTDPTQNPIIFSINDNFLQVSQGVFPAVNLHNSRVSISNLYFQNLSRTNTPGVFRISFTLTYNNPENRKENDYAKTFYATASLR